MLALYDEFDTYWQNGGYKKISDIIFAECHIFIVERLRYPGFGVRVRVVSSCFTDVCNSSYFFCFLAIDNDIMRKMCTLITSKATDIDENIANQNHATRTRSPKPGYLNLSSI
jgi:hypothetical protein